MVSSTKIKVQVMFKNIIAKDIYLYWSIFTPLISLVLCLRADDNDSRCRDILKRHLSGSICMIPATPHLFVTPPGSEWLAAWGRRWAAWVAAAASHGHTVRSVLATAALAPWQDWRECGWRVPGLGHL